ncbi:NAD-dependent epimerase/dehydratase family protein [Chloroflexota bacterium]
MTRVLLTGGSGFLGINLAKKLLEKGQDVKIYDTRPPTGIRSEVEYINGDIREREKLEKALTGVHIVYHTIALVPISNAGKAFWEINVEGAEIAASVALNKGVERFVHISSSSIYDLGGSMPLTEKSAVKKDAGGYEGTKYHGELRIQKLIKAGLAATIIRPRTIIGPGRGGIFQILYDWIMRGKRVYIIGKGDNRFQMISSSDLCDVCILAAENDKSVGEVFNIGTDRYGTLKEDLDKLIQNAGTGSEIMPVPARLAKIPLSILFHLGLSPLVPWHYNSMYRTFYLDITKAKQLLGWEPLYSNQEMLIESYDWYLEHYKEFETGTSHTQAPDQKILKWLRKIS